MQSSVYSRGSYRASGTRKGAINNVLSVPSSSVPAFIVFAMLHPDSPRHLPHTSILPLSGCITSLLYVISHLHHVHVHTLVYSLISTHVRVGCACHSGIDTHSLTRFVRWSVYLVPALESTIKCTRKYMSNEPSVSRPNLYITTHRCRAGESNVQVKPCCNKRYPSGSQDTPPPRFISSGWIVKVCGPDHSTDLASGLCRRQCEGCSVVG
ncbi:hypothetical protein EV401DRAFT_1627558 [Pisolithus croceorrhizus]|nr:hypothetical protein EV401DRAFT_1627558 [Pisolithus croceorrhizus]